MTFLEIGKSGDVLQETAEVAVQKSGKGRVMGIDRLLPVSLTVAGSVLGTALLDVNWGALAGTIGAGGMAVAGAYFAFMSNKTKAFVADQAAKLEVAERAENSRIELLERESAARLKIQRAEAAARVKIQREQEDANRVSLTAKVRQLEAKLEEKRKQWHDQADAQNGILDKVRADLFLAQIRVAKLEGQLGVTDKAHSEAINANSDNIVALGEKTRTELPAPTPHVEPIVPETDDEIAPFPGRFPDNHGPRPGP